MSFATDTRLKNANIAYSATAIATDSNTVSHVASPFKLRNAVSVGAGTDGGGEPTATAVGGGVAAGAGVTADDTTSAGWTTGSVVIWPRLLTWSVHRVPSQ